MGETVELSEGAVARRRCRVRERVPYERRLAVDRAIVERGTGRDSLEAIRRELELDTYGVGVQAFRRYAKQVESEARDYFLASMLGAVFGGMTPSRRGQVHDAAQNMVAGLVLKTVRALADEVSIDDLAKLVRINLDLRKAASTQLPEGWVDAHPGSTGSDGLAGQVRQLYGIELQAADGAAGA